MFPTTRTRFPIELFRRIRFRDGVYCPRCGHTRVHRWGHLGWRRRYRCLGCRRTFSDFTGTPLAYLKHVNVWPTFCRLVIRQATVRNVARTLGIDKATSFRWRHRLLASLRRTERSNLRGRVSINATWFPLSEKGSRSLDRAPRRYRFEGLSFQGDGTWFVLACDERGRALDARIGPRVPGVAGIRVALEAGAAGAAMLLAGGGHAARVRHAATQLGLAFEKEVPRWVGQPQLEPPERALDWGNRFKGWIGGHFRGVATRYLEHYLVWHRLVDLVAGRWVDPPPLEGVLIGAFP